MHVSTKIALFLLVFQIHQIPPAASGSPEDLDAKAGGEPLDRRDAPGCRIPLGSVYQRVRGSLQTDVMLSRSIQTTYK